MGRLIQAFCGIWIACAAIVALPGATAGPNDAMVVQKAFKLMPPALADILAERRTELLAGVREGQAAETTTATRARLLTEFARLEQNLGGRPDFREMARQMGRIAGLIINLDELGLWAPEARHAGRFQDFGQYLRNEADRFVAVFYGYAPELFQQGAPAAYLDNMAARNQEAATQVVSIYEEGGNSRTFDERSPAFAAGAIHFSHTITDIANFWLYAWWKAGGAVDGARYFPYRPRAGASL